MDTESAMSALEMLVPDFDSSFFHKSMEEEQRGSDVDWDFSSPPVFSLSLSREAKMGIGELE